MYKIFCCRNRRTSRVEVDEITDSLERCLSVERGVAEFSSFLERNRFETESTTLAFALKCQSLSTDLSRLSPTTRKTGMLPGRLRCDIGSLHRMADNVNFDLDQMNTLGNLESVDVAEKMRILEMARTWAIDLLRASYNAFRNDALRRV